MRYAIVISTEGQFDYNEADVFIRHKFVNKRLKKKVPQTYKRTELSNHYYMYCHYVIISSNHERKATFRIFGILVTADPHHW
jgi:hypothetical protein